MGRYHDEESQSSGGGSSYSDDASSAVSSSAVSSGGGGKGKTVPPDGEDGALRPIAGNTPMELLAGTIAAASVASSAAAMVLQPVNIVFAAGGLSCAIGPYAYWQQRRLTDVIAMQETHAALAEQIDRLGNENVRLKETVNDLSDTVDRLEDVEQAFDVLTMQQGQSIEAFEEQVADNRRILGEMRTNLKANVLQNLLQVVIRSDSDDDMQIEGKEVAELVDRIRGINGVEVNEELFRERVEGSGGSLQCVMDVIRNLMSDEPVKGDEQIFVIHE